MAFKSLVYAFKSLLPSAKMTDLFNNTVALRDGTAKYGGVSTGAANIYDCVFVPVFTAYNEPMLLSFRAHQNNAASSTFKADALAALTLKKFEKGLQVNLVAGDIKINEVYFVFYQATVGVAVLLNPSQIVLPSNVPLLDVSNVFTADQEIVKASPTLILDATSGVPSVLFQNAGADVSKVLWDEGNNEVSITNSAGSSKFSYNVVADKMSRGVVPLARMGTSVLDSSTAVIAGGAGVVTIEGASAVAKFYVYSVYGSSSVPWHHGSRVGGDETVTAEAHSFIRRANSGDSDKILLINGAGSTHTANYKIYKLAET